MAYALQLREFRGPKFRSEERASDHERQQDGHEKLKLFLFCLKEGFFGFRGVVHKVRCSRIAAVSHAPPRWGRSAG